MSYHTRIYYLKTKEPLNWAAVKELSLSYHNPKTMLFTIYTSYGNLNEIPWQQPSLSGVWIQEAVEVGQEVSVRVQAARGRLVLSMLPLNAAPWHGGPRSISISTSISIPMSISPLKEPFEGNLGLP